MVIGLARWPRTRSERPQSERSIANARKVVGCHLQDDPEVDYADEVRELMLEPARETMLAGRRQREHRGNGGIE